MCRRCLVERLSSWVPALGALALYVLLRAYGQSTYPARIFYFALIAYGKADFFPAWVTVVPIAVGTALHNARVPLPEELDAFAVAVLLYALFAAHVTGRLTWPPCAYEMWDRTEEEDERDESEEECLSSPRASATAACGTSPTRRSLAAESLSKPVPSNVVWPVYSPVFEYRTTQIDREKLREAGHVTVIPDHIVRLPRVSDEDALKTEIQGREKLEALMAEVGKISDEVNIDAMATRMQTVSRMVDESDDFSPEEKEAIRSFVQSSCRAVKAAGEGTATMEHVTEMKQALSRAEATSRSEYRRRKRCSGYHCVHGRTFCADCGLVKADMCEEPRPEKYHCQPE